MALTHKQAFTMYLREWRKYGDTQAEVDFGEYMRGIKEMVKCEACRKWFEAEEVDLIVAADWGEEWFVCFDDVADMRRRLEEEGVELLAED